MILNAPIKINWDGQEYKTILDMRLISVIDAEVDLIDFVEKRDAGAAQVTKVSAFIAIILSDAGAEIDVDGPKKRKRPITSEDVFNAIFVSQEITAKAATAFMNMVMPLMFPQSKKKLDSTEKKKKAVKRKAKKT